MTKRIKVLILVGVLAILIFSLFVGVTSINGDNISNKLVGKWNSNVSLFSIEFKKNGECIATVTNNVFSLNSSSQNEVTSDIKEYKGNYSVDDGNKLTISIVDSINKEFQLSNDEDVNSDEWVITLDNVLKLGNDNYNKEGK